MKTSTFLILPLVALLVAGCSDKSEPENTPPARPPTLSERANTLAEKTNQTASEARAALDAKLTEWKLTPSDIKADLEKTGRVVRERALATGERVGGALDNARVVAVINGKYIADSDLSALDLNVDADKSVVTLTGSVASVELAGRAIALALDTEGVTQVVSLLKVGSPASSATPSTATSEAL
jgi:osmotically-inducible protein OsmY